MSTIKTYSYTNEQLEAELSKGVNVILNAMEKNGDITKEVQRKYDLNYAIIIREMSLFSSWWTRHFGKDKNQNYLIAVEQHSFNPDDYEKPSSDQEEKNNE